MLKLEIRGKTIRFASKRKHATREQEREIEKHIEELKAQVDNSNTTLPSEMLAKKEKELEELRWPIIQGAMMRSKSKYYEAGEKPTKYFCNLERRNYVAKTMSHLVVDNTVITEHQEILNQQKLYYQNLYATKRASIDNSNNIFSEFFLKTENIKKLSKAQSAQCEGLITLAEVKQVLKGMANCKSPGSDGFTAEFYKFFLPDLGHFLVRSLNFAFLSGEVSVTQKQGVITCLPKGDKPREFLKNWRPITLLNIDYKLLSGAIAQRVKSVLNDIIDVTQKGFLRNRFISENTRLVYDVIDYMRKSDKNGVLLLINFEKAFDSLEWDYIEKVLKVYNFGSDMRKWFNVLYKAMSTVINNGYFSEFFNITRGCRQGDPLSPYLFILCVEPLAAAIRSDTDIKGLKIGKHSHKIGQFADDTFLFQDGSVDSMLRTFEILDLFYECSGLKTNKDKTLAVWLGPKCKRWTNLMNRVRLKWVEEFTLLGIYYNMDEEIMLRTNYDKRVTEMETILNLYGRRNLSLIGKVTVVKTLAVPKLIHVLQTLPSPSLGIVNKIKGIIRKFLWGGKRAKISLEQLGKSIENGGLALTNIDLLFKSIKVSWVRRLILKDGGWQSLFEDTICDEKIRIWQLDKTSLHAVVKRLSNRFWRDVILSWIPFYDVCEGENRSVLSFPLWNSFYVTNRNIIAMKTKLIQNGVMCIKDLFHENGDILTVQEFNDKYMVKMNFLDHKGLINSIPQKWIGKGVYERERVKSMHCKSLLFVQENYKCNKAIYKLLNDNTPLNVQNNMNKWSLILGENIDEREWIQIRCMPWHTTIETRLRTFQYHIINRTLVTNKHLYQWHLVDSELCQFCNKYVESIEHIFVECEIVNRLKDTFFSLIGNYFQLNDIVQNPKCILFGIGRSDNLKLLNHVLMIFKKYVYNCRCTNRKLEINGVISMIKTCNEIEFHLACSNGAQSLNKYNKKWQPFIQNGKFILI